MAPPLRIYLNGRVCVEGAGLLVDETLLTRQARLLLVYMALERARPVSREEIATAIWQDEPPPAADSALNALISNLRSFLARAGLSREAIERVGPCYQLRLPAEAWLDVEAAVGALDEAEGALRAGDVLRAWGNAGVVTAVARRPFLPGEERPWIERQRRRQNDILFRGLECFVDICSAIGEPALAIRAAEDMTALEPFRESGYRRLMQAHVARGDRAEALRVFGHCRSLLEVELGVGPSPETEAAYLELLRL